MDGFSIANAGVVSEQTSAERAAWTDQAINNDPTNSARQVQGLSNNQRVREKEEDDESGKNQQNQPQNEVFEDGLVQEEVLEEPEEIDVEDFDNPNKEFYVKLNIKDDIIELYDNTTDRLIESISGSELGELVQRLNMASGIFVNKKV
jgi:uncharacterized FlaG/YvyC family protein